MRFFGTKSDSKVHAVRKNGEYSEEFWQIEHRKGWVVRAQRQAHTSGGTASKEYNLAIFIKLTNAHFL